MATGAGLAYACWSRASATGAEKKARSDQDQDREREREKERELDLELGLGGGAGGEDEDEDEELVADFHQACDFVENTSLVAADVFEQGELLELYGLFKQATCGDCDRDAAAGAVAGAGGAKGGLFGFVKGAGMGLSLNPKDRAKRKAWRANGGMRASTAMTMYVGKVLAKATQKDIAFELSSRSGGAGASMESSWVTHSVLRDAYEELDADARARSGDNGAGGEGEGEGPVVEPSALHTAADQGNLALVLQLLASGEADPNVVDRDGQTPLHYAAICEYKEVYDALLAAGADEGQEDHDGETPASWTPEHWKRHAGAGGEGAAETAAQFIGWSSDK